MKNYLLLIVDSLNYSHVQQSDIELMPFLQSIAEKGIYCTNMYSQAPYTEAASMPLYAGQNVLDYGGYLKRFKDSPDTIFDAMREGGYTTFYNSYQPQCYPTSMRRGIDIVHYSVGYDLTALWSYRLSHYADLKKKGLLDERDIENIKDIMEDNFTEWLTWTDAEIDRTYEANMICDNSDIYDAQAVKNAVLREREEYLKDKVAYINAVLEQGKSHSIYSIPAYAQNRKIKDRDIIPEAQRLFRPMFKDIARMNRKLNLKNNKHIFKGVFSKFGKFLKNPSKLTYKNFLKSAYIAVNVIIDLDLKQRIADNYDSFKNAPSARSHFDHYINWALTEQEKPHFACIHIDDIHNPEIFFSYDSSDIEVLKEEQAAAADVLSQIGKKYKGNITHDLSLRYMDNAIKYLCERLEREGLMENTCLIVTADHGFSFSGNPLRDSFIVNFYLENYKVPFVIYNSDHAPQRIDRLTSTKDIPATIVKLALGKDDEKFSGVSVTNDHSYESVMIEYCGGGCPDLRRRVLEIAAFDKEWFVGARCTLEDEFGEAYITEIYDLKNDPSQFKNLLKEDKLGEVAYLTDTIKNRLADVKETQKNYN